MPSYRDDSFQPMGRPVGDAGDTTVWRTGQIDPRLSRSNYFDGRLLTAADLTRDQLYLDQRLLEVGQAGGDGVVGGLEATLDQHRIEVRPGLAVSASGRVLVLEETLVVDLGDRAAIAALNDPKLHRFPSALYAVVLMHTELGTDSAEVYPQDLGESRRFHYDRISDAVELVLVPLRLPVPGGTALAARAQLVRTLVNGGTLDGLIPDQGVALGVLAVRNDLPLWFDPWLLRHPRRRDDAPDALQEDLHRHYLELYREVVAERREAGLSAAFAADEYFHQLPPAGPLPKEAVDPVAGSQQFFPEGVEVAVTLVRDDEFPQLLRDTLALPPLDLDRHDPAEVMVVVRMNPAGYARWSSALEHGVRERDVEAGNRPTWPTVVEPLRLRLFGEPERAMDLDSDSWKAIWRDAAEEDVYYLRRPHATAGGRVSAVVLAQGFEPPAAATTTPGAPAEPDPGLLQELTDTHAALDQAESEKERLQGQLAQSESEKRQLIDTLTRQINDEQQAARAARNEADARIASLLAQIESLRQAAAAGDAKEAAEADWQATLEEQKRNDLAAWARELQGRRDSDTAAWLREFENRKGLDLEEWRRNHASQQESDRAQWLGDFAAEKRADRSRWLGELEVEIDQQRSQLQRNLLEEQNQTRRQWEQDFAAEQNDATRAWQNELERRKESDLASWSDSLANRKSRDRSAWSTELAAIKREDRNSWTLEMERIQALNIIEMENQVNTLKAQNSSYTLIKLNPTLLQPGK